MKKTTLTIQNPSGLHAKPASLLAEKARSYRSALTLRCGETQADLKNIISLLCAGVSMGSVVELAADGEDEDAALHGIAALIASFRE